MTDDTTYEVEMTNGRASLATRDWDQAYRHFGRAHGPGVRGAGHGPVASGG